MGRSLSSSLLPLALGLAFAFIGRQVSERRDARGAPWSAAQVDAALDGAIVLHVAGHHRGGTTVLWDALRHVPAIAGFDPAATCRMRRHFGCAPRPARCACMEYEGLFV